MVRRTNSGENTTTNSTWLDRVKATGPAALVLFGATTLAACSGSSEAAPDRESSRDNTSVAAEQHLPDNESDFIAYQPSTEEKTNLASLTGESYEELKTPIELTSEQIAAWESGSKKERNVIASELFADRYGLVLYEAVQAILNGSDFDASSITDDEAVKENIRHFAEIFIESHQMISQNGTELGAIIAFQPERIDPAGEAALNPHTFSLKSDPNLLDYGSVDPENSGARIPVSLISENDLNGEKSYRDPINGEKYSATLVLPTNMSLVVEGTSLRAVSSGNN